MGSNRLKIISGGQTGADRAALDWALANGIPHGGWCPKDRLAEDGIIPPRYHLFETESADYKERTEKNVIYSHGTVIFSLAGPLTGGTRLTADLALRYHKPLLQLDKSTACPGRKLADFIRTHHITRLNVAGPRASQEPEIAAFVLQVLSEFRGLEC